VANKIIGGQAASGCKSRWPADDGEIKDLSTQY